MAATSGSGMPGGVVPEAERTTHLLFEELQSQFGEAEVATEALKLAAMNRLAERLSVAPTDQLGAFLFALYGKQLGTDNSENSHQAKYQALERQFDDKSLTRVFGVLKRQAYAVTEAGRAHRIAPGLFEAYMAARPDTEVGYYPPSKFSAVRYSTSLEDDSIIGEVFVPTISIEIDPAKRTVIREGRYLLQRVVRPRSMSAPNAFTKITETGFESGLADLSSQELTAPTSLVQTLTQIHEASGLLRQHS